MFKLPFFSSHKKPETPPEGEARKTTLILGLGNPGERYRRTYHNAGHLYIDFATQGPFKKYKHFAFNRQGNLILAKSLTYMNQSGLSAVEALKYFNLTPRSLLVAHDDSDLPLGKHKLSASQGSAGHKGVQSIINQLGTKDFARLRIGVRGKAPGKAGEFVLKPMGPAELEILQEGFEKITLPQA
ncbi:MAG: aminoacyl-tRNA hydrolase [bacterium]|nr:aminoacyl-tRNA hydrolase [bacterium]